MKMFSRLFQLMLLFTLLSVPILPMKADDIEKNINHPDGTVETTKTTKYYDPSQERRITLLIYGVSILFGGIISWGGVRIILCSLTVGNAQAVAELDLDIRKQRLKIKKLAQGSLVVLIGAIIILWSVYRMRQIDNVPQRIELSKAQYERTA